MAIGVSPLALNVISRKTTVTTRKSIMLVSDRLALVLRVPPPVTFFCDELEPHVLHEATAGLVDGSVMASCPQLTAKVMLNAGTFLVLRAEVHVPMRLVDRVDDADDVL